MMTITTTIGDRQFSQHKIIWLDLLSNKWRNLMPRLFHVRHPKN